MSELQTLGFSLATAFASGLRLYATVSLLGLLQRYHVINLPPSLQILAHPIVLSTAVALCVIEFFADKIPYVDTVWDAVHTFIRPPAAAVLAYSAFGDLPESWRIAAGLLGGSVALTSHGTKASARAAINASPEPVSNWTASLGEEGIVVFLAWLAASHPVIALISVSVLLAISIYLLVHLAKYVRRLFRRLFIRSRPA